MVLLLHSYFLLIPVEVERSTSITRLMLRNNLSEEQARQRVEAQLTNDQRREAAHRVFDNNQSGESGVTSSLQDEVTSALHHLTSH